MKQDKHYFWDTTTILIAICVGLGVLLRIGNPLDLSFINDELSTWSKISFNSLAEVIENIRTDDSHPVGMYVFLYYWTGIFGTSVFAIKLPFFLMSIASMFLVYRIASIWFSSTVGLFVLAYFCSLQFPIWWSVIARQYQSGLFCTLIMAYFWSMIFLEKSKNNWHWIGFVLAGAASMYNHYFSLVFAAFLGLSGILWLRKGLVIKYFVSGIIMVLLFLPHIGITNYQFLHADGHKWYETPTPDFITNHLFYIFHYSVLSCGLIILLFLGSVILYWKITFRAKVKIRLTALFLFLAPLLFGYFYSVYNSPILRESHLLFSFPYLLLFLLSFFPEKMPQKGKVFGTLEYLQHRTKDTIRVFFCQEDKITMTGLQISDPSRDLTNPKDLEVLSDPDAIQGKVKVFQIDKSYSQKRPDEVYSMMSQDGCQPAPKGMFDLLVKMYSQTT